MEREIWLNVTTADDLLVELGAALERRRPEARAELWARVIDVLSRATGVAKEKITGETTLEQLGVYFR